MLYRVVYLSSAQQHFGPVEFDLLLAASRRRNIRDDITGLLLHDGGHFIQALEGEERILRHLMRRIETDPRHGSVSYVAAGEINSRMFGRWAMASGRAAPGSIPAMIDAIRVSRDGTSDIALAMLKVFMRDMRPERAGAPALRRPVVPPLRRARPELIAQSSIQPAPALTGMSSPLSVHERSRRDATINVN